MIFINGKKKKLDQFIEDHLDKIEHEEIDVVWAYVSSYAPNIRSYIEKQLTQGKI